jgi:hypothetical protein
MSRRLRTVLELLGGIAVIAALTLAAPEFDYESRYRYDDVAVGELGRLREYDATVPAVRLVRSVALYEEAISTEHAFVVITIEAAVRTEGQGFGNLELRTRSGHRYEPRPDWFAAGLKPTQPGFSVRGAQVYEVPTDRLRGAVLIIGPDEGETTTFDAAVRVDLGLSGREPVEPGPVVLPESSTWVTA